ncbi:hypothetical protein XENOCAPTIV_015164 [Xenoophorus captivus]|uniref:Uncharacterized protein n=1 Tax=Xenoophorus captivus TaxID=1517983 RepID=A0ABV0SFQ7_9TELE
MLTKIKTKPITWQQVNAFRRGKDNLLRFKEGLDVENALLMSMDRLVPTHNMLKLELGCSSKNPQDVPVLLSGEQNTETTIHTGSPKLHNNRLENVAWSNKSQFKQ